MSVLDDPRLDVDLPPEGDGPRADPRRLLGGLLAVTVGVVGFALVRGDDRTEDAGAVAVVPGAAAEAAGADEAAAEDLPDLVGVGAGAEDAGTSADTETVALDGAAAPEAAGDSGETVVAAAADGTDELGDLDGESATADDACLMSVGSLRVGADGPSVGCLQAALIEAGALDGAPTSVFDDATLRAVMRVQEERSLFVDGVVGRETAISLGIWPDEESFVVHTPPPPPGAMDLTGFPLSPVSVSGPDAPPLPANSGSGRRLVYDRMGQRVWAVDDNERVLRSWLVAGSKYANELPGTHYVYSKSEVSTAWNGEAYLPYMVRWLQTQRGHIGFHGIPTRVADGTPYMTIDEFGQRLSGGCQRQADEDALFVWNFADIGTKVVVT
jgi:peptidoglycan hydrolase-like protein with peptidoglycan-binding domain